VDHSEPFLAAVCPRTEVVAHLSGNTKQGTGHPVCKRGREHNGRQALVADER
jgi:hypothetical protein